MVRLSSPILLRRLCLHTHRRRVSKGKQGQQKHKRDGNKRRKHSRSEYSPKPKSKTRTRRQNLCAVAFWYCLIVRILLPKLPNFCLPLCKRREHYESKPQEPPKRCRICYLERIQLLQHGMLLHHNRKWPRRRWWCSLRP